MFVLCFTFSCHANEAAVFIAFREASDYCNFGVDRLPFGSRIFVLSFPQLL